MPRGDRTGPAGQGSQTGRGAGYCTGNNTAGCFNNSIGFGGGHGRRARNWNAGVGIVAVQPTNDNVPVQQLTDQLAAMQNQLETLQNQISDMQKQDDE